MGKRSSGHRRKRTVRKKAAVKRSKALPSMAGTIQVPAPQPPRIATLVDYDNLTGTAKAAGFTVSFPRIKEFARNLGRVLFAEVFTPPRPLRPETLAYLWGAGFTVITCPRATKDTDAVDNKINWRARLLLEDTPVDTILIFSQDRDFVELVDFAADRGKRVIIVDVTEKKEEVEGNGEEAPFKLMDSQTVTRFIAAGHQLEAGLGSRDADEQERIRFLTDIVKAMAAREDADQRKICFMPLRDYLYESLQERWAGVFTAEELRQALSALVRLEIVGKMVGARVTYYTLNRSRPEVLRIIAQ